MPVLEKDGLRYFQFECFPLPLVHGVFTRHGGVSPRPWSSLNVGGTVGDDPGRVRENRHLVLSALHRSPDSVCDVWQVHGTEVVQALEPRGLGAPPVQADILLTDRPGITLMMRFADCVPIFLSDPIHRAIGLVHAGWLGTVRGAVSVAVQAMRARFGTKPGDLVVGIGPSIGPDHYEIGNDVLNQIQQTLGKAASGLVFNRHGRKYLDLWSANQLLLERTGVRQVELAGLCTACGIQDWFSHRAEHGQTGRFAAIFALG